MKLPTTALALLLLTVGADPAAAATTPSSPPTVTDQALTASVVDLTVDRTVLDVVATTQSIDGAVSDSVSPDLRTVTLAADVLFAFGSADLAAGSAPSLAEAVAAARGSGSTVAFDGYTDAVGDGTSNLTLCQQRAAAVLAVVQPQLPDARFTVTGRGEADPIAPNNNSDGTDNAAGRALNRRVTLTVTR